MNKLNLPDSNGSFIFSGVDIIIPITNSLDNDLHTSTKDGNSLYILFRDIGFTII